MSYDAIIFDFDGVLISSRSTPAGIYEEATRDLLTAFGQPQTNEWPLALQNPGSAAEFRAVCTQFDLPPAAAWTYREAAASGIERSWIGNPERQRYADAEVLSTLSDEYAIGIASNNRHALVAHCVDRFDWGDFVDAQRGRYPTLEEFDHRKPDPRFIEWTIEAMGVSNPLYVGDRATDVIAAERVGCDAALLTRSGVTPPESAAPAFEIASLRELEELATTDWIAT